VSRINACSSRARSSWTAGLALLFLASPVAATNPQLKTKVSADAPIKRVPTGYFDFKNGIVGYIPPSAAGKRAPLLVLLHGAGREGVDMVERFKAEADRRGVILLAPKSGDITWDTILYFNPDYGSFAPIAKLPPTNPPVAFGADIKRVDQALSLLLEHVAVDPARVGLLGFSDGATYALAIGPRNPGLFSTVIALSPGFAFPTMRKGRRQRIFLAHGTEDRVLPYIGSKRDIVPNLIRHGHQVTFVRFNSGHEVPADIAAQAIDFFLDESRK
jgi:phospholipase/carboxylesterase